MELGVMGFMNAALGFLFLAIVYLSSSIRCLGDAARTVRATRECVNQREMSTTSNGFFRPPEKLRPGRDRKSTRLNSSHRCNSYAVFCLKKKKDNITSLH